ncbi:MAG TPA: type II toxin-antitoxin system VapC family toxin [Aestuariivirgaceae bacterium]|nr:type II toxin-antitoxin system VapC family toxin [Aestuariivirgaceae bacterium]
MAEAVLDASAILALVRQESGADVVGQIIARSIVSTVNASEAVAKLVQKGVEPETAEEIIFGLPFQTVDFDREMAAAAGRMWLRGSKAGLSFGDRACLALAEGSGLPAITTDQQWRRFMTAVEIRYIR